MSYYKITYESDTIEGLKAIQGSFSGSGAGATGATNAETPAPPPSLQDKESADATIMEAPPLANDAGGGSDIQDGNSFPPPPLQEDPGIKENGSEGEIPPPSL